VQAEIGSYNDATTVPTAAVQLNGSESFVFLVQPDSTVTRRTVTVARTVGDLAIISSGVKPGDHVVIEGQLKLVEGSHVKETVGTATGGPAAGAAG
jgi:multidrug efflux system membrane fusion protein